MRSLIHARIPMPSADDRSAAYASRNQRSLRSWSLHAEGCSEQIEMHEAIKAKAEQEIAQWQSERARAKANVKAAEEAIATGQPAPRPLSRREWIKLFEDLGFTKQRRHRLVKVSDAIKAVGGVEAYLQERTRRPRDVYGRLTFKPYLPDEDELGDPDDRIASDDPGEGTAHAPDTAGAPSPSDVDGR